MQPDERDAAHLWDMLEAARGVARFTKGLLLTDFLADDRELTRLSVERELEILGEAARRMTPAFRDTHPELPWREIIGLRNVISHAYDEVDYEEIYEIAQIQIPRLIAQLAALAPPAPEGQQ